MESSNSFNAKQSGTSHKPFPFIYALFPKGQNTQYVVHNVRPLLQGFGVGHSFCWQGENIANYRCIWQCSVFSTPYFYIWLFKPKWFGVRTLSSTSQNTKIRNPYEHMETNEEMASSMVEEQFNHFRVKKVTFEEAKSPLGWWRMHEAQFSYLDLVAPQIMGIVGS